MEKIDSGKENINSKKKSAGKKIYSEKNINVMIKLRYLLKKNSGNKI